MINSSKTLLIGALFMLAACSETNSDKITDAQICLDKATATTAQACVDKVSGLSSKEASFIRCSANFITEGFGTPAKIIDAFSALEDKSGNPTLTAMTTLIFTSQGGSTDPDANSAFAQATFNHCEAAGNKGMVLIASFANMATTIAKAGGSTLFDGTATPAELSAAITSLGNASDDVLGATALAAYQVSCSGGESSNAELCGELENAVAGGATSAEIGAALRATLKAP